jgi:two-component system chemotaxis response regulator CheY
MCVGIAEFRIGKMISAMWNGKFETLKVLLIDDEPFMRKLVGDVLDHIGVRHIDTSHDGNNALRLITKSVQKYDLIICDLEMPVMSGLEFIRAFRSLPKKHRPDTPIIVLTGHSEDSNLQTALEAGIHGFLKKPISKALLTSRIEHAMTSPPYDANILKQDC